MPSRTEGFGLTGLEALSAGIPVVVSKNSGFGEALGSVRFGSYFVIDSEDPSTWKKAIKDIWDKDRKKQLEEVKDVRSFYCEEYSWSKQCKSLIEKMFKLVDETPRTPDEDEDQHPLKEYGEEFIKILIKSTDLGKEKKEAVEKMLSFTLQNYLKFNDHSRDNHAQAMKSLTDHLFIIYNASLVTVQGGSIIIIVKCPLLESLERLWTGYRNGNLDKVAERYLVTNEMRKELNLETACLTTTIEEENYLKCKKALMGLPKACSDFPPRVAPKMTTGMIEENLRKRPPGCASSVLRKWPIGIGTAQAAGESVSFKPGTVSDADFLGLAHELGPSWKKVGLALEVPKAVISQIEAKKSEVSDRCYAVLTAWQERYPKDATYHRLALALKHAAVGRADVADKYCSP
ncbi:PREDICTED: uncharacterized protein LOC107347423 [Acropora digitifera]|uniref:uncharacterized protein LOC107347423 n=1 Tax=Acropora digitifera TaxID=70779 RepID=UPI00077A29C5|nr:PREDICTED: uncharacterized protein LOC107347423 [Acropora digitifera]